MKISRRRALWFDADSDSVSCVFEAGGALANWRERAGGRRALRRARRTASPVVFTEPEPSLGVHAGAASGMVVREIGPA